MLAAKILRSGDMKVKIEMEMTLDELKEIRDALDNGVVVHFKNGAIWELIKKIDHVSNEIEQIFGGELGDE